MTEVTSNVIVDAGLDVTEAAPHIEALPEVQDTLGQVTARQCTEEALRREKRMRDAEEFRARSNQFAQLSVLKGSLPPGENEVKPKKVVTQEAVASEEVRQDQRRQRNRRERPNRAERRVTADAPKDAEPAVSVMNFSIGKDDGLTSRHPRYPHVPVYSYSVKDPIEVQYRTAGGKHYISIVRMFGGQRAKTLAEIQVANEFEGLILKNSFANCFSTMAKSMFS